MPLSALKIRLINKLGVHPDVLKLGLVSFLTDLSSEMIYSVFAIFFTTVAGASAALLGLVEGLADLSASSLNYYAGWLSDRSGKRKIFSLAGYGFSTLAKVILLVSNSVTGLTVFRVIERLGKGFRGPPRLCHGHVQLCDGDGLFTRFFDRRCVVAAQPSHRVLNGGKRCLAGLDHVCCAAS